MGSTRAFPLPWYVNDGLGTSCVWGVCEPTDQASAPVLNGLLFATYRFLLKVQVRPDDDEPPLAQIFLAGAGCGLASTYVNVRAYLPAKPNIDSLILTGCSRRPSNSSSIPNSTNRGNNMALKLYYHPLSSFCWKALIALYENDTPFEPVLVDLMNPVERDKFLKIWPLGTPHHPIFLKGVPPQPESPYKKAIQT